MSKSEDQELMELEYNQAKISNKYVREFETIYLHLMTSSFSDDICETYVKPAVHLTLGSFSYVFTSKKINKFVKKYIYTLTDKLAHIMYYSHTQVLKNIFDNKEIKVFNVYKNICNLSLDDPKILSDIHSLLTTRYDINEIVKNYINYLIETHKVPFTNYFVTFGVFDMDEKILSKQIIIRSSFIKIWRSKVIDIYTFVYYKYILYIMYEILQDNKKLKNIISSDVHLYVKLLWVYSDALNCIPQIVSDIKWLKKQNKKEIIEIVAMMQRILNEKELTIEQLINDKVEVINL